MVELLEYALVVLVSGLMAVFSFNVYSAFSASAASARDQAAYSSYVSLAYAALEQGNAEANLTLNGASLNCGGGSLGFRSPSFSASTPFPAPCDFDYSPVTGTHLFSFSYSGGSLSLEVR